MYSGSFNEAFCSLLILCFSHFHTSTKFNNAGESEHLYLILYFNDGGFWVNKCVYILITLYIFVVLCAPAVNPFRC